MKWLLRVRAFGVAGLAVLLAGLTGCQTWVPTAGMTLPSGHYLQHGPNISRHRRRSRCPRNWPRWRRTTPPPARHCPLPPRRRSRWSPGRSGRNSAPCGSCRPKGGYQTFSKPASSRLFSFATGFSQWSGARLLLTPPPSLFHQGLRLFLGWVVRRGRVGRVVEAHHMLCKGMPSLQRIGGPRRLDPPYDLKLRINHPQEKSAEIWDAHPLHHSYLFSETSPRFRGYALAGTLPHIC